MMKKQNFSDAKEVHLYPSITSCPVCHKKLTITSHQRRYVKTTQGNILLINHIVSCTNQNCELLDKSIHPEKETFVALKGYTYGLDVVVFIGQKYFHEHLSSIEILNLLNTKYNMNISKAEVCRLIKVFEVLLKISIENDTEQILKLRQQGGIILSIDGIQPEKGNDTIYIFRDIISGTPLLIVQLSDNSSDEIAKQIERIKYMGIRILGVISDNQRSLVLAIKKALPNVPHQLCQYHYLRDAFKPLIETDSKLYTQIKREIRGIKGVEKAIEEDKFINEIERQALKGFCFALRQVLKENGMYPFDPPGIKIFEKIKLIDEAINTCLKQKESPHLHKMAKITQVWKEFHTQVAQVKIGWEWLYKIAELLKSSEDEKDPLERLKSYIDAVQEQYSGCIKMNQWINVIQKTTKSFGEKLFTFWEQPLLPRTNNDMEIFIGSIRKIARKTIGRKKVSDYILSRAETVALILTMPKDINLQSRFSKIDFEEVKQSLSKIYVNSHMTLQRKIKKDIVGFLREQIDKWCRI